MKNLYEELDNILEENNRMLDDICFVTLDEIGINRKTFYEKAKECNYKHTTEINPSLKIVGRDFVLVWDKNTGFRFVFLDYPEERNNHRDLKIN